MYQQVQQVTNSSAVVTVELPLVQAKKSFSGHVACSRDLTRSRTQAHVARLQAAKFNGMIAGIILIASFPLCLSAPLGTLKPLAFVCGPGPVWEATSCYDASDTQHRLIGWQGESFNPEDVFGLEEPETRYAQMSGAVGRSPSCLAWWRSFARYVDGSPCAGLSRYLSSPSRFCGRILSHKLKLGTSQSWQLPG